MSRTQRGAKAPGYEFWSRRPQSGGVGPESKRICHGQERAQAKALVREEVGKSGYFSDQDWINAGCPEELDA